MLFLACSLVLCGYGEYTVGIDIEGYFNLRYSTRCRSNSVEVEDTDLLVVLCHRTLALEYTNLNRWLIVSSCREYLLLVHRNGSVALDELGHHTAEGLDTE